MRGEEEREREAQRTGGQEKKGDLEKQKREGGREGGREGRYVRGWRRR